jgi:hypothetical protein
MICYNKVCDWLASSDLKSTSLAPIVPPSRRDVGLSYEITYSGRIRYAVYE